MRRVVVTGMGAITPIGLNVDEFWKGIRESKVGIGPITKFDTTDFKVKIAAEVKDFVGKDYMEPKTAKRMELFSQYAVAAAKEAIEQANLDMTKEDPYRVGTAVGSGTGSLQAVERNVKRLEEKGPARIEPLLVPMMISNMASGNVSIYFGLKGKSINVVTACATGTHNIGEAFRTIQYGDADVMIAGGTEACGGFRRRSFRSGFGRRFFRGWLVIWIFISCKVESMGFLTGLLCFIGNDTSVYCTVGNICGRS